MRKKANEAIQKSRKFFVRMLQVFLALIKPASTIPKPACMKNTRNAPSRTQTVYRPCATSSTLKATFSRLKPSSPANALLFSATDNARPTAHTLHRLTLALRVFTITSSVPYWPKESNSAKPFSKPNTADRLHHVVALLHAQVVCQQPPRRQTHT